ncbi:hypothetical protein BS78_01G005100 [Paspalum vaginatum]|nr:hypothetical protein BS78_01G005100 [Paspalum vaginatum]
MTTPWSEVEMENKRFEVAPATYAHEISPSAPPGPWLWERVAAHLGGAWTPDAVRRRFESLQLDLVDIIARHHSSSPNNNGTGTGGSNNTTNRRRANNNSTRSDRRPQT